MKNNINFTTAQELIYIEESYFDDIDLKNIPKLLKIINDYDSHFLNQDEYNRLNVLKIYLTNKIIIDKIDIKKDNFKKNNT